MGKKSGGSKQKRGRGKPRNRAPPPPPGVKSQGGDKVEGEASSKQKEGKTPEESGKQEPEEVHTYMMCDNILCFVSSFDDAHLESVYQIRYRLKECLCDIYIHCNTYSELT